MGSMLWTFRSQLVCLVLGVVLGAWGPVWASSFASPDLSPPPTAAQLAEMELQVAVDARCQELLGGREGSEVKYMRIRREVEEAFRAAQ